MPERGGTTTQNGIYYQNSVAVLAMLDMLDMNPAPAHQRVTDVRVEAPDQVDDIVVRHADATAIYQNVKLELPTGEAWDKLWKQLGAQRTNPGFHENDTMQVVVANSTQRFDDCVEMSKRAQAEGLDEWVARLSKRHITVLDDIVKQVGSRHAALAIFQRTSFIHWSQEHVEAEFARRRLAAGGSTALPNILRDVISGGAGHRAHYRAGPLRRRLALEHNLHLEEPPAWGLTAYREAIKNQGTITIPGTDRSGRVEELFVWPTARDFQSDGLRGFEDEDPGYWREPTRDSVDLRDFPQQEFDRIVVVAGPGYGKSALLTALSSGLAQGPYVPVETPLAQLAMSGTNVLAFVEEHLSNEYGLAADWRRLAEQGLLVLLYDGLDEIPASDRTVVLRRIAQFSSIYPHCPWLLTARDPAVVSGLPDARLLELTPLSDQDIASFAAVIAGHLESIDASNFVNRLRQYPDLNRLARIPLFLSMLLATTDAQELKPMNRADLIEGYLNTLIAPAAHKVVTDGLPAPSLRTIAQDVAFRKIERRRSASARLRSEPSSPSTHQTPKPPKGSSSSFGATASSKRKAWSVSDSRTRSSRSTWRPAISWSAKQTPSAPGSTMPSAGPGLR
jgi:hypothetical protein